MGAQALTDSLNEPHRGATTRQAPALSSAEDEEDSVPTVCTDLGHDGEVYSIEETRKKKKESSAAAPSFGSSSEGPAAQNFCGAIYILPEVDRTSDLIPLFTGLVVTPGYALLDTGAQQAVMGKREFDDLVERLRVFGLKPNVLPTNTRGGAGIGGTTEFLATVEIPCAWQR